MDPLRIGRSVARVARARLTRRAVLAVGGVGLTGALLDRVDLRAKAAAAQAATPAATPVPGAQTWRMLVNNVSPPGRTWSFNTFYPDRLQAHPGDTIVFTLAPNPMAFHTIHILTVGMTPLEWYSGFSGGFLQSDLTRPGGWQRPFFGIEAGSLGLPASCGRAGQPPCLYSYDNIGFPGAEFGLNSGVLVNPPPSGGQGNPSFTVTLAPGLHPGPYYVTSDVDGPTMSARIDVVPADQPVQSAEDLQADAQRQYAADLAWLAGHDRIANPPEASNPDGTKTWQVDAGSGAPDKPWLAINAFQPSTMAIIAGDTVTWTNKSPGATAHTVSGFAPTPDALPQNLSPYLAGCLASNGQLQLPPAGSFPPDIWNTCPGAEVNDLTGASQPSAPSGDPYTQGDRTSGILLNQAYLDSPIGTGLPYPSSYRVTFPNPGTYYYQCAIHPDMIGVVVVLPKPRAF
jgi:plastocyanin